MLTVVAVSFIISYLMILWYRTNAFVEYVNLLKLSKWFHVADYAELQRAGYGGNYVSFLAEYYSDKFFVRLVTCSLCLSFWAGGISALFLGSLGGLLCPPLILFFFSLFNRML